MQADTATAREAEERLATVAIVAAAKQAVPAKAMALAEDTEATVRGPNGLPLETL